jgi:hypothetical protein
MLVGRKNLDILQGLALVGQLGLVISLPLVAMVVLARFLSLRYGYDLTFLLAGIIAGLYMGFVNAYRLLMKK